MNACDRCHRRKSKCDKQLPFCGPCVKAGVACVYTDRSKEPTYRREVVERLERRLRQCEATNRALAARLATAQASNGNNSDDGPKAIPATTQTSDRPHGHGNRPDGGNEVTDEVSYLSLSAGGERQFLGSASGVLFANLVRATIDAPALASPTVGAMTPGKFESSTTTAFHSSSTFPLSPLPAIHSIPKADYSQLLPEAFARDLHHAYFEHDHLCYPFLHRPTVLAAFEQIYRDPTYLERDVSAFFVFYMVLAISSVDFHKYDWQTRPDAEKFHGIALSRLNEMLQVGGLMALQAILLLCQYRMRSSVRDTSGSTCPLSVVFLARD